MDEIMYYLFINGKPYLYYATEAEAEEAVEDWCADHYMNTGECIEPKDMNYEIKPFTEFNEEFPDPYNEYDD